MLHHAYLLFIVAVLAAASCRGAADDAGAATAGAAGSPAQDAAGGQVAATAGAGTFDVAVGGALTTRLRGRAAFGSGRDARTGNQGFAISLQLDDGRGIMLTLVDQTRPGTGTYPVAASGPGVDPRRLPAGQFVAYLAIGNDVYSATGGTVRLTTSTDRRVAGEVDFTATSMMPTSSGQITVRGSFDAPGLDVGTL